MDILFGQPAILRSPAMMQGRVRSFSQSHFSSIYSSAAVFTFLVFFAVSTSSSSALARSSDDDAPAKRESQKEEETSDNDGRRTSDCAEPAVQKRVVRVLILDLEVGQPGLESQAAALAPVIAREAKRAKGYEIITSGEIRSALSQEAAKQLTGCDDSSCLAEVAEALDADLLVRGRLDVVSLVGEDDADTGAPLTEAVAPVLSLSLLNTRAIVTVNRVSMSWPGDPSLLPDVARAATQLLIFEKKDRVPGTISVEGAPDNAQIFVDDTEITEATRVGDQPTVEVGPHRIRILADGYLTRSLFVLIKSGEATRVDGTLEEQGFSPWWIWGGVGTALVAGMAATFLVVAATAEAPVGVNVNPSTPSFERLRTAQ